jgi:hypothetical protein
MSISIVIKINPIAGDFLFVVINIFYLGVPSGGLSITIFWFVTSQAQDKPKGFPFLSLTQLEKLKIPKTSWNLGFTYYCQTELVEV